MTDAKEQLQISSWSDLFMRTMELGLGAATLTVETAQKAVNDLVKRGQVTREEGTGMVDKLLAMGRDQRRQIMEMVDKGAERAMARMDLARRSDLEVLRQRVAALEKAVLGATPDEGPISPIIVDTDVTDNE